MFYGLNKLIKNLLPKRLFYRALLIVAVPVFIKVVTFSVVSLIVVFLCCNME